MDQPREFMPQDNKRPPVTERRLLWMLSYALRNESFFKIASSVLKPEDFSEAHELHGVVWSCVLDYHENFQALPTYDEIGCEFEQRIVDFVSDYASEEMDNLSDWLNQTFDYDGDFETNKFVRQARTILREYLEDLASEKMRSELGRGGSVDLENYVEKLRTKSRRIAMVVDEAVPDSFPPGWSEEELSPTRDTTIPVVNMMLDGGDAPGEAYGFVAPFGTCKTTFAIQMAVGRAELARCVWQQSNRELPLGMVYYFYYEGQAVQIRSRVLTFGAKIRKDRLRNLRELNGPGQYDDYEREVFRDLFDAGVPVPSEQQRIRRLTNAMNDNLRLVNMVGTDRENPGRGCGYTTEISRVIEQDLEQRREKLKTDVYVEAVIIDYVGAMVERAETVNNWSDNKCRQYVEKAPFHAINDIATPLQTPVWLLHQLSGQANSYSPGRVPDGTETKGSKSFKENLDFLIVSGSKNAQSQCCWRADKARRFVESARPEVMQIDGEMARVYSVSEDFTLDMNTGSIVPTSEMRNLYGSPQFDEASDDEYGHTTGTVPANNARRQIMRNNRRRRQS
jgi:hypothetical protein